MVSNKIPDLRFAGFKSEWQHYKLGELGELIGGGTPSTTVKEFWSGEIPWISSSDLNEQSILEIRKTRFINNNAILKSATKLIPKNSVLIVSRVGVGKIAVNDVDLCTSQDFTNLKPLKDNSLFLAYLLKVKTTKLLELNQGTSIKGFTKSDLESLEIRVPIIEEQNKIASLFTIVDARIQALKKKMELLEQYKKGVIQKIFSQEFRFKDENGGIYPNWREIYLSDILSIPEKEKPVEINPDKILTVKLHLKGVTKNISTEGLYIGSTNYYIRHAGQFIYGKQNLFNGAFGIVPNELDGFLSSGDVPALDINFQLTDKIFFYYLFARESFYRKLAVIASGSGSKRIHEEILLNTKVMLPSLDEQQKIANILSSMDLNILKLRGIIEKAVVWKKGLLQKMFV